MKKIIWIYVILISILFSCEKDEPVDFNISISDDARYYMDYAFDIMEDNCIVKNEIDWESFRSKYYDKAKNAQTYSDTYPIISNALQELHPHSFFRSPSVVTAINSRDDSELDWPEAKLVDSIAYIKIPGFSGTSEQAQKFADLIHNSIQNMDSILIKGWIVDLTNNTGGNMYPMIAGIGPLFNCDTLGYFIDPENNSIPWRYNNGSSLYGSNAICTVSTPYSFINRNLKIAVLQSNYTASSGEATLISFIGNNNTKTFGIESAGYSTANRTYIMPDNALLILTISYMANRNKIKYGNKIQPDVSCTVDEALDKAKQWILE